LLDAGDALSPSHVLTEEQRPRVVATAGFLVQQLAAQGLDALALGDRDLALGAETLKGLATSAPFPFVATNLVDAKGEPVFRPWVLIERGGLRVLVLGLVGQGAARMAERSLQQAGWRFDPTIDATKRALAAVSPAPDLVIVLSQLNANEESELQAAVPQARVFLGGDSMAMSTEVASVGQGISASGGQKGKQLSFLTLTFADPRGASAPLVDPGRTSAAEAKKASAERRIQTLERLIADAKAQESGTPTPSATPPGTDAGAPPVRPPRKKPIEAYERQLAGARAELQLAESDIAASRASGAETGTLVSLEVVQMEAAVPDDAATSSAVETFRKTWPDPTKAHAPAPPGGPMGPGGGAQPAVVPPEPPH